MKGFMTIVLGAMLTVSACAFGSKTDSITSDRNVSDFTGVDVGNGIKTNVTIGDSCGATVTAPADVIDNIVTEVKNGTLFIYYKKKQDIKKLDRIEVNVTAVSINRIKTSSGARVTTDSINADVLTLAASSGSQLEVTAHANSVVAKASSGSVIEIAGNSQKSDFDASSGARIKAEKLLADNGTARASSGAGVTINTSTRLDAEASSGGRIRYTGTPSNTMVSASSGGSVSRLK